MKISILTGIFDTSGDMKGLRDPSVILQLLHDVGYDVVDIGFCTQNNPEFILRQDDWKQRIEAVGNTAAKLGMQIGQSHLPYHKKNNDRAVDLTKPGYMEYYNEMLRRSYEASSMLGVPYATLHPFTYVDSLSNHELHRQRNYEYMAPMVEYGAHLNVGTAIENMRPESPHWKILGRYCQDYHHLIELVDSFNDPMVGICWDTGHANQSACNQYEALTAIGKRLKNLHLNDNHFGTHDQHLLPYMGEVNWDDVMRALVEIGYEGVLNYEVGKVCKNAPFELQKAFLPHIYKNACQLLALYEQKLAEHQA